VTTNNAAGYTLSVKASASPALVKGTPTADSFADYTESPSQTPDTWGGVATGSKEFGFSARGNDILAKFGTATTCGNTVSGAPDINSKFLGFETGDQQIAGSSTITTPTGTTTYICFAAEQGTNIYAASGAYTATITGTAVVL
jgi:hypothetical protein